MQIGAMTNPRLDPLPQIRWIGANGKFGLVFDPGL